jgi:hypothetical protein
MTRLATKKSPSAPPRETAVTPKTAIAKFIAGAQAL